MPEPTLPEGMFDTEKGRAHIEALNREFTFQARADDSCVEESYSEDGLNGNIEAARRHALEGLRLCTVHDPEFHTRPDVTAEESHEYLDKLRTHWVSSYNWYY